MKNFILLVATLFVMSINLSSCSSNQKSAKVKCYKIHDNGSSDPNAFLYYYILFNNNNGGTYYSYTSATPVTDFNNTQWTTSSTEPIAVADATPYQEISEPLSELPSSIEVEMSEEGSGAIDPVESQGTETGTDNSNDGGSGGSSGESDGGGGASDGGGGGDGGE